MSISSDQPHRRRNPLTGGWVLVSPQRNRRPWQGQTESIAPPANRYDPDCYLCPGNPRAGGHKNPNYLGPYVFDNDFPALVSTESPAGDDAGPLFRTEAVGGKCRVICYSPRHDLSLAEMPITEVRGVVDTWADQTEELGEDYCWVQVFENRGAVMGCSNPHPHGQIWATDHLPHEAKLEEQNQRAYHDEHDEPLLVAYGRREEQLEMRVVTQNKEWLAVVPYWAAWPFETLLLPRRPVQRLNHLSGAERDGLAGLLRTLLAACDRLFDTPFPYSMGWHGAPTDADYAHWQLHGHIYPPLLRSATVRKFMVGYEMLAEPQRDLNPEDAAQLLREKCRRSSL